VYEWASLIPASGHSIVAVHGLNGDPVETWTHAKTKDSWLKDYLPSDIQNARILSFGYNADIAFGNTTASIKDHAQDLLGSLIDEREKADISPSEALLWRVFALALSIWSLH